MNEKQKEAWRIVMTALNNIANKKAGPCYNYPVYAMSAMKQALDVLKTKRNFTLDTDSDSVSMGYHIAKQFIEKFLEKESDVFLEETCEYESENHIQKGLYQLTLNDKTATHDMIDWLDTQTDAYTFDKDGVKLFFEITKPTGTETAYILQLNKKDKK